MTQASFQLNQLLGDGALLNAMKKGMLNPAGIVPATSGEVDAFRSLLAGILKARNGDTVSQILTTQTTGVVKKPDGQIAVSQLPILPKFIAALKNLSPEEMKGLPPEIAALLAQPVILDAAVDGKPLTVLDVLSSLRPGDAESPELVELFNDPELAGLLEGFIAQFEALDQQDAAAIEAKIMPAPPAPAVRPARPFVNFLPQTMGNTAVIDAADVAAYKDLTLLPQKTISIADLDADGFQALKKLAFADIAPYLTMPRKVHASGDTVMKVAQGPSFLNEGNTDSSLLASIAGLVPVLPPEVVSAPITTGGELPIVIAVDAPATQVAPAATPVFLDSAVLANAAAATDAVTPQKTAVKHASFFAALLGLPVHETPAAQTVAAPAPVAAPAAPEGITPQVASDAAKAPVMPALTAAIQSSVKTAQTLAPATAPIVSTAASRGFAQVLTGMDVAVGGELPEGLEASLQIRADQSAPITSTTTLTAAKTASAGHPATHLVSVTVQRMAGEASVAGSERQFTIQLEPANLGRVKITLEFGENNTVKAKLLAERPETVAMLQKDAALLERALQNSGLDAKGDSFSFDLAGDNAFTNNGGHDHHEAAGRENQPADGDGTEFATLETVLPVFVDPKTGLTHVNIVI